MGKVGRSIELVKASWAVLRQDKELLALPAISGLCALVVIASFGVPVAALTISANGSTSGDEISYPPVAIALAFVGYLVLTFTGMFFNSALIHAANERMDGGNPTLGSAIRGASQRVSRIFVWAMVAATVSIIIRSVQERLGIFGRLLAFVAGTAWAVVTFLVLPVIIIEDLAPVDSVKRSTALLRKSWGEGLAGHLGLGVINVMIFFGLVIIVGISAVASPVLLYGTIPLALLALLIAIVVMSALATVFQTALYRFAVELPVDNFDSGLMNDAFSHKKNWTPPPPNQPDYYTS